MRYYFALFFLIVFSGCSCQPTSGYLVQIRQNDKFGFINTDGKIVIKPIFISAGEFSEGLASARVDGMYGYIDTTGNFTIPPLFDYATPFSDGLAIVYTDGRPFVINRKGVKVFENNFPVIGRFENGRALVQTRTKKFGFVNKAGELVIDTMFRKINPFISNLAVVEGLNHRPSSDRKRGIKTNYEKGVIDTLGNFLVPYGKFENIGDFEGGYFKVEIPAEPWDTLDGFSQKTGFIDRSGKLVLAKNHKNNSCLLYTSPSPRDGLLSRMPSSA